MAYATEQAAALQQDDIVLEALPDAVLASMENRDRWLTTLPHGTDAFEFLLSNLQAWGPDQTVRVAFLGGNAQLHGAVEDTCKQIPEACGLSLSFRDENDAFRTWSTTDSGHSAEIRVSFDMEGYFSLVGTDSIASNIGPPNGPVGGRPHQRSLNLGGFAHNLPPRWKGTVRHEFLHALAFHHEHQNMRGPCEAAFRFEDDPGYQPTEDAQGRYVQDASGRRPGVYTYLSGFPNFWSRAKVDHNLRGIRAGAGTGITAGLFDAASCMLYRFPSMFYRTHPSPCAPLGDGENLSDGDKTGLQSLYPKQAEARNAIVERRMTLVEDMVAGGTVSSPLLEDATNQLRAGIS